MFVRILRILALHHEIWNILILSIHLYISFLIIIIRLILPRILIIIQLLLNVLILASITRHIEHLIIILPKYCLL